VSFVNRLVYRVTAVSFVLATAAFLGDLTRAGVIA
jgi:hypothetical protein